MRKIPTVFQRDPDNMKHVTHEVTPGCEWVLAGEGVATRKFDGTCVLVRGGQMWARREVKKGKPSPPEFIPTDHDDVTGKSVGWVPVTDAPEWARHWEAFEADRPSDGTYELCGPKVNGNPEHLIRHTLIRHGGFEFEHGDVPCNYGDLMAWLIQHDYEGIVWWREPGNLAGDLAKLKRRDFT